MRSTCQIPSSTNQNKLILRLLCLWLIPSLGIAGIAVYLLLLCLWLIPSSGIAGIAVYLLLLCM